MWSQLNDMVQGNTNVRCFLTIQSHKVRIEDAENALMADDEYGFASAFHLLCQWFQSECDVHIGFAPWIPIRQLVRLPSRKLIGKYLFNLLIRHSIANPRIQLIQIPSRHSSKLHPLSRFSIIPRMFKLVVFDELRRFPRTSQGGRPQSAGAFLAHDLVDVFFSNVCNVFLGELGQSTGVFDASGGEATVATDFAQEVVFGLSVAS
mmetsp:Transcript_66791/g.100711  ORF Transcript_66791/g.100711 Transcript_66791/m.100711 type:complete len:206 (-) Transcript_66791:1015-1632(-)